MTGDYYKQDVRRLRTALRHFALQTKPTLEEGICVSCGHPIITERYQEMGTEVFEVRCRCHEEIPFILGKETEEKD